VIRRAAAILLLAVATQAARAAETDQYMTWSVELNDSAPALNAYLNEQVVEFIESRNRWTRPIKTEEEVAMAFYGYLFEGLHKSRVRTWLFTADEVDRYPDNDVSVWEYQRSSIYRELSFPFFLPMARSVRLGEVYLGIDKVGHFFGFGRRYYAQYVRLIEEGRSEEEAIESVVKRGYFQERSMVGGLVDGIFSYGDLEANYQGMRLCRQLASGTPPCFVKGEDGLWRFEGSIDILPYITPDMDESWNNSRYTGRRKRNVLRRLGEEDYCELKRGPIVAERFQRYATYPESLSQQLILRDYDEEGRNLQQEQSLCALCDDKSAQATETP